MRKTPKNKSSLEMNDKMMDIVMNTMASVSEKLAAMNDLGLYTVTLLH